MIRLLVCVSLFSFTLALKCYVDSNGDLNLPFNSSAVPIECIGTAYSCYKVVDYAKKWYQKGCNMNQNCTVPNTNGQYGPAACYNTSRPPSYTGEIVPEQATCCCYGDGCNPSSFTSSWLALLFPLLSIIIFSRNTPSIH